MSKEPCSPRSEAIRARLSRTRRRPAFRASSTELAPKLHGEHLLVLDNCEQVREPLRAILEPLVAQCARLTILATSPTLSVTAERVLPVDPLALPAPATERDLDQLSGVESVALLRCRAARRARIRLDRKTAADLIEICRQLDGNPLRVGAGGSVS